MSGMLEKNFGQLRNRIEGLEDNIINAFNNQKDIEIHNIRQQLAIKDEKIKELSKILGDLKT